MSHIVRHTHVTDTVSIIMLHVTDTVSIIMLHVTDTVSIIMGLPVVTVRNLLLTSLFVNGYCLSHHRPPVSRQIL